MFCSEKRVCLCQRSGFGRRRREFCLLNKNRWFFGCILVFLVTYYRHEIVRTQENYRIKILDRRDTFTRHVERGVTFNDK
jgi:hypothetical protein